MQVRRPTAPQRRFGAVSAICRPRSGRQNVDSTARGRLSSPHASDFLLNAPRNAAAVDRPGPARDLHGLDFELELLHWVLRDRHRQRQHDDASFVAQLQIQDANGDITDTFDRGETIIFVLTVRNRLDTSASAEFTTTRTSDFVVLRENTDDVVWQWSDGRSFSDVATTIEFAPGETRTFTETWDQILSNGTQLRSGTYEARGVLVFSGFDSDPLRSNQMGSTLERFTIR